MKVDLYFLFVLSLRCIQDLFLYSLSISEERPIIFTVKIFYLHSSISIYKYIYLLHLRPDEYYFKGDLILYNDVNIEVALYLFSRLVL